MASVWCCIVACIWLILAAMQVVVWCLLLMQSYFCAMCRRLVMAPSAVASSARAQRGGELYCPGGQGESGQGPVFV